MDIETSLSWFYQRQGKVTYSMTSRLGPNSYDCSSAVYFALISGGFFPSNIRIGNTDSLFGDLERNGWTQVPLDANGNAKTQRGDVGIWGRRGASTGAAGHTFQFINENDIIHCSYGYNGIHVDNHDWLWQYNGQPPYTFYRFTGKLAPQTGIQKGDTVKFTGTYTAEEIQTVYNIKQIRTTALYKQNFDWGDNGVPVSAAIKVDNKGYRLDTPLAVGDKYVIPGKFSVADVLADAGGNYALVNGVGGEQVWFIVDALTESTDATPVPRYKPSTKPPVEPEKPVEPTPEPEPQPKPEEPQKEDYMAYNSDEVKQLKVATERVQDLVNDVASSQEVQEITDSIPKPVKVSVYIFGDFLIGMGLIIPSLAVALGSELSVAQVTAYSSVFAMSGAFLLTMFGIYKAGKK